MAFFNRDTQVSRSLNLCPLHHFEFSVKTGDRAARLLLSCAHDLPQGEDLAPFFLQEIQKLSTKTL